MPNNRTATTPAKATEKSQQYEVSTKLRSHSQSHLLHRMSTNKKQTLNFQKGSSQPSERARADYGLTVQRDWGRSGDKIRGQGTTHDSPMLQRWQNETAKEQPYNAIEDTERAWGQSGGNGGQGTTGQAHSSSRESPMLQHWRNESAKEQPYNAIGAVGVRGERSSVPPKGGDKA